MEKTNSVETSETLELCPEIGTVNCRVPDWSEHMEALGGTQDIMIFDGFRCHDFAGGAGRSTYGAYLATGREAVDNPTYGACLATGREAVYNPTYGACPATGREAVYNPTYGACLASGACLATGREAVYNPTYGACPATGREAVYNPKFGARRVGACRATDREAVPGDVKKSIMEALRDPNIYTIGVCGSEGGAGNNRNALLILLNSIIRKIERDNLFNIIVMECMRSVSDLTQVQKQIAEELGFSIPKDGKRRCMFLFRVNKKQVVAENAKLISERIRAQPTILFIFRNPPTALDLAKIGIPIGEDHTGCKVIITSDSEEILSKMNVQRSYSV